MTVASIHQNSFTVNVEWSVKISYGTCTSFLFSIQNLFYLFKTKFLKNYLHCFFRSMKHLTQASHPYLQRETMRMEQGDDEVIEGRDKKI